MTREAYTHFIRDGGRGRIGHPATALLEVIVTRAEEQGYPEVVAISVSDIKYWCKFSSNADAYAARKTLLDKKMVKSYEKENKNVGLFYLEYDKKKEIEKI